MTIARQFGLGFLAAACLAGVASRALAFPGAPPKSDGSAGSFDAQFGNLATGNDAAVPAMLAAVALQGLPAELTARVTGFDDPLAAPGLAGALIEGEGETVAEAARRLSARSGPILRAAALSHAELAAGEDYPLTLLVEECSISTNIAAAGGNASLMTIG